MTKNLRGKIMRIGIVNCFETYNIRAQQTKVYFESMGCKVDIIVSNFSHRDKVQIDNKEKGTIVIDVPAYKKNLSIRRMYSHFSFAKKVRGVIEKENYDLLYVLIPPNTLVSQIYKSSYNSILVYDIIDLWPEAMPLGKLKNLKIARFWSNIRDKHLNNADVVITECEMYADFLKKTNKSIPFNTVYFNGGIPIETEYKEKDYNRINLCYIGSINNLLDIDLLFDLLVNLNNKIKVTFNIIGDGEKKKDLVEKLILSNVSFNDYGIIFDELKKKDIISQCDFGLNFMKSSTKVGLTMKSIEYFRYGLPIINNIPYDTWNFVKDYEIGLNLERGNEEIVANRMINLKRSNLIDSYRLNTRQMYQTYFSESSYTAKMNEIFYDKFLGELNAKY